jgi:hypothetical protein
MEQLARQGSRKAAMSYAQVRKELVEQSQTDRIPCRYCGAPTLRETLTMYGARCPNCYQAYCRGDRDPEPPMSIEDKRATLEALRSLTARSAPPREWAHKLKSRHESGEWLTPAQVSAYKAALHMAEAIE